MVWFQPSSDTPVLGPLSPSVPALLKAMSSFPNCLGRQRHQGLGVVFGAHVAGQRRGGSAFRFDLGEQAGEFGLPAGSDDELWLLPPRRVWRWRGQCRRWRR